MALRYRNKIGFYWAYPLELRWLCKWFHRKSLLLWTSLGGRNWWRLSNRDLRFEEKKKKSQVALLSIKRSSSFYIMGFKIQYHQLPVLQELPTEPHTVHFQGSYEVKISWEDFRSLYQSLLCPIKVTMQQTWPLTCVCRADMYYWTSWSWQCNYGEQIQQFSGGQKQTFSGAVSLIAFGRMIRRAIIF